MSRENLTHDTRGALLAAPAVSNLERFFPWVLECLLVLGLRTRGTKNKHLCGASTIGEPNFLRPFYLFNFSEIPMYMTLLLFPLLSSLFSSISKSRGKQIPSKVILAKEEALPIGT